MDPALFDRALAQVDAQRRPPATPDAAPSTAPAPPPSNQGETQQGARPEARPAMVRTDAEGRAVATRMPPSMTGGMAESMLTGATRAFFETKDFLLGEPEEGDKSTFRRNVEGLGEDLAAESQINAAIIPISQFATGMIGIGKVTAGLKAVGLGRTALTTGGKVAAETAKAAAVGAVAFDPHEERLSNVIESFPGLRNVVTGYLAADPEDSANEGRLKAVLESVGMDAATVGTFSLALRLYRAVRGGNAAAVQAAEEALEAGSLTATASTGVPDPAEGMVRVYHGGATEYELETDSDLWFTSNKALAQQYADRAEGEVWYVDLPSTHRNLEPTWPEQGVEQGFTFSFNLPEAEARARQRLHPSAPVTAEGATVVKTPSQAEVAQGVGRTAKATPVTTDEATDLLFHSVNDADALLVHGSRQAAVEAGRPMSTASLPWQKLASGEEDLQAFIGRVADAREGEIGAAKGGAVLPDAALQRLVNQRVALWGDDPVLVRNLLVGAGANARTLAVNMEAADALAVKAMDEAYQVLARMKAGNLAEWGGDRAAALQEFTLRAGAASQLLAAGRSMLSNAGRTLRRGRGDLARLSAVDLRQLDTLPPEKLAKLFESTGGDIRAMKEALTRPSMLARIVDWSNFLLVNNLLWGVTTHAVNLSTTAYMMAARPAERIIGAAIRGGPESGAIMRSSTRQYRYMAGSIADSFRVAAKAFIEGDSVLAPFKVDFGTREARGATGGSIRSQSETMALSSPDRGAGREIGFRPIHNVEDLAVNALMAVKTAIGVPTRVLGTVDELTRQITYRGIISADASMEADVKGLTGAARRDYIRDRVAGSFDEFGAGTDARALQEAATVNFQQPLLAKTWGADVQNIVARHPLARQVLPFVRTPTNVLRSGIKMTPGLNLLQTEYRAMIKGQMGAEQQAQAIGQMSLGSLLVGSVAVLAANGMFTGAGPSDPNARKALVAAGWKPNSIVVQQEDGTVDYYQVGRFDPIGLPLGIVADMMDLMVLHPEKAEEVDNVGVALTLAIIGQIRERTYLQGVVQFLDAVSEPDKRGAQLAGRMASNLVPFASAFRNYGGQDMQTMREARTMLDSIMATVPWTAGSIPAKYDAWGDPITIRRGPWSTVEDHVVDQEMIRMGLESGESIAPPSPYRGKGLDLREITLADGRNAYAVMQEYAGHPPGGGRSLKDTIAALIQSDAYQRASDGGSDVVATRQHFLSRLVGKYREAGFRRLMAESMEVRQAMQAADRKAIAAFAARTSGNETTIRNRETSEGLAEFIEGFGLGPGASK